jgi:hypothetical protein
MIEITEKNGANAVLKDYALNFTPRTETGIKLNFEQMLDVLKDKEDVRNTIHLVPQFNFYLQKLFVSSWEEITKDISQEEKKNLLQDLKTVTMYDSIYEFKSLVILIELKFFPDSIDNFYLSRIFAGATSMDIHCMYLAYDLYCSRPKSETD